MSDRLVIAVTHASIGSGHRIAAESIAAAIHRINPDVEVHLTDILDYGSARIDGDVATTAFSGQLGPMYDVVWSSRSIGRFVWGSTGWITRALYSDYTDWLREIQADAVVCAHALAANIAAGSRIRLGREIPLICVPTDYGVHGFWPHRHISAICVGVEQIASELIADGLDPSLIQVTGIPTRAGFGTHGDVGVVRAELGLPADRSLTVVLAGASMAGPYRRIKRLLARTLVALSESNRGAGNIVIVTGRDDAFAAQLQELADAQKLTNVTIRSYVSEMDKLMAAADLVICKPGGLTCTESVCSNAPMILVGEAVGQERVNVDLLERLGAAVHVDDDDSLIRAHTALTLNPHALDHMREATTRIARPDAADRIAEQALLHAQRARPFARR